MLDQYFGDYITVLVFMAVGALIVGGALLASTLLRPNHPNKTKSEIYECGINPVGGGWSQSHIRYYIFALLFLIFDVEAAFIYPWAVVFREVGGVALIEMGIFLSVLLVALVYAWRKGVLEWV